MNDCCLLVYVQKRGRILVVFHFLGFLFFFFFFSSWWNFLRGRIKIWGLHICIFMSSDVIKWCFCAQRIWFKLLSGVLVF